MRDYLTQYLLGMSVIAGAGMALLALMLLIRTVLKLDPLPERGTRIVALLLGLMIAGNASEQILSAALGGTSAWLASHSDVLTPTIALVVLARTGIAVFSWATVIYGVRSWMRSEG